MTASEIEPTPSYRDVRESVDTARTFLSDFLDTFSMSDVEMYAGLSDEVVANLRARVAETPLLRTTLCQAARYRTARRTTTTASRPARHVYFIEAVTSQLIKIGCATDASNRLTTLQIGSPEPLRLLGIAVDGGMRMEAALHREFADYRSHGEWFRPSDELYARMAEVCGR